MVPFQKKLYYAPSMKGSCSIKKVLPALLPELSYDSLEVADGGMAMSASETLMNETDKTKIDELRKNLLEYCKLDTWAMVKIVERLEGLL